MFKNQTVKGDGNCLFRTLSVFAFDDENKWRKVKEMLGDFLSNDPELLGTAFPNKSVQEFVNNYRKDGYWGGYIELTAFALLYNVKLVVHMSQTKNKIVVGGENDIDASVHHLSFEGSHYEPLRDIFFEHFDPSEV